MIQARDEDGLEESGRRSAERWSNYDSRSEVEEERKRDIKKDAKKLAMNTWENGVIH